MNDSRDSSSQDGTSESAGRPVEDVEQFDLAHLLRVVWHWRMLVLAGMVFVVGSSVVLLRVTTPPFKAETVLIFQQPTIGAVDGQQGLADTQNLISLLPTYAQLASSDAVLSRVAEGDELDLDVDQLRSKIDVQPLEEVLGLRVAARDDEALVAEHVVTTFTRAFIEELQAQQASLGVPDQQRILLSPTVTPDSVRPGRNETRTIILAGLLGFAVMIVVSFFLESLRPAVRHRPGEF